MQKEFKGENLDLDFQLLFFYAGYSATCNYNLGLLDYIAQRFPKLKIIKVNTTKYPTLKKQFNIHMIPAFVILWNGNVISKSLGSQNKIVLGSWVEQYYSLVR